jgi:hypothetical protein
MLSGLGLEFRSLGAECCPLTPVQLPANWKFFQMHVSKLNKKILAISFCQFLHHINT